MVVVHQTAEVEHIGIIALAVQAVQNRHEPAAQAGAPRVYWNSTNGKKSCKGTQLWTYATVKDILNNERYRGILRMNYTGSRSYKDAKIRNIPFAGSVFAMLSFGSRL